MWYGADMAVQNVIGDSFRGATWVALHNGGGVGWCVCSASMIVIVCRPFFRGEVINGGFGLLLDGSEVSVLKIVLFCSYRALSMCI